jgi:hypothetical protein
MKPAAVIEGFDVIENGATSLGEALEALVINQFVFERTEEGFDERVIVAVALSTH